MSDNGIFHPDNENEPEYNKRGKYQYYIELVQMTVLSVQLMIAHQSPYMKKHTVDLHKQETGRICQIQLRESREGASHAALKRKNTIKTEN